MTANERRFLLLLIVNFIIVLIYLLVHWIRNRIGKESKQYSYPIRALVMLLCPGVGVLFFGIGFLLCKTVFLSAIDLEDVIFSKERVKTYAYADEEQERNMVPLGDAIAVSDTDSLRRLMLNVVKGDIQKSLSAIYLALNSEDSETSHYAAAVLQNALNDFRARTTDAHTKICSDDEEFEPEYAAMMFDYMNSVLRQNVFTAVEQTARVQMMDEVADKIWEKKKAYLTSERMESVAMRLLEIDEYEPCAKWCERMEYMFPELLATYTCRLKLYFNKGDRRNFFRVLNELKRSDIIVDNETLELIRVFL